MAFQFASLHEPTKVSVMEEKPFLSTSSVRIQISSFLVLHLTVLVR